MLNNAGSFRNHYRNLSVFMFALASSAHALPFLGQEEVLLGSFSINHRHGGSYSDNVQNINSSDEDPDKIMNKLASIIASPTDESKKEEEARLWKRLGKLRLDAGEYAEAPRIFRRGAERCPQDEALQHHLKVFNAFHNQKFDRNQDQKDFEELHLPPLEINNEDSNEGELFLTLDIPPNAVPSAIIEMARKHSGDTSSASLSHLLYASKKPILNKEACQYLINAAQKAADKGGWVTNRHVQAPTCDIPAFDLEPSAVQWIKDAMQRVLFPLLAKAFPSELGVDPKSLRIQDMFVVRYDADNEEGKPGYAHLKPHEDESIISLTIALNDMSCYDGGGLFITSTGALLNGDAGTVLGFAGGIVHGGYPVQSGTRWILTVFLYIDENLSKNDAGYTLQTIYQMVKQQINE